MAIRLAEVAEGVGCYSVGCRAPLLLEHIVGRRRQCRGAVTGGAHAGELCLEDVAMNRGAIRLEDAARSQGSYTPGGCSEEPGELCSVVAMETDPLILAAREETGQHMGE